MLFTVLLSLTTFSIAGTAAFFSVYGLANMFAGYFWSVAFMGSALEAGKLIAASYLYRYWKQTSILMRTYLLFAVFVLMVITSTGIFGYLSAGYQSDTAPLKQSQQQISLIDNELVALQTRKLEIDGQISKLNATDVIGRQRLTRMFDQEIRSINKWIPDLTQQKQQLMQKNLEIEAHVGPIVYIAGAFGLSTDDAIKYIILLLIAVFDPLAIILTICLNVVLAERRNKSDQVVAINTTPVTPPEVSNELGEQDQPNTRAFTDIAFDLIGNRTVTPSMDRPTSNITDAVSHAVQSETHSPVEDVQQHDEVELVEQETTQSHTALEVEPDDQPTEVEQTTPEVIADTHQLESVIPGPELIVDDVEPLVEHQPDPPTPIVAPKDSILDRWLKFKQH